MVLLHQLFLLLYKEVLILRSLFLESSTLSSHLLCLFLLLLEELDLHRVNSALLLKGGQLCPPQGRHTHPLPGRPHTRPPQRHQEGDGGEVRGHSGGKDSG